MKAMDLLPREVKSSKAHSHPPRIPALYLVPNEGRKVMATSNFATENQTFHLLNLLGKTGLFTDFKPKALGRWINLKPLLVQCMEPSRPELSSPKLHMDTSCLSVLSSNVTSSERITFLTLLSKAVRRPSWPHLTLSSPNIYLYSKMSQFSYLSPY